jgi:hypothetical protein
MSSGEEIRELERLFQAAPHSREFIRRQRESKWGERIRTTVVRGIEDRDPDSIEDGIRYLEANPWYFRSGYHKGIVAHKLKSAPLSGPQRTRLRAVLLASITQRMGPEFGHYCRLAIRLCDEAFLEALQARSTDCIGEPRRRAVRMLGACCRHSSQGLHTGD